MDKTYLGQRLAQFTPGMAHRPITRVNLLDSNGDLLHTAGNDEGGTLEAVNPDATQAMAEAILASVQGFTYRPYEGQDAVLDPAAELGDGITVGGTYSLLGRSDTTFDLLTTSEIGAPAGDEIDDEYPYRDPIQKLIQRNIQSVRSFITKTATEINMTVEDQAKQLGTTLRVGLDGVTITDAKGEAVVISGGQIDASTINAAQLDASKINAGDLNMRGVLSWGDFSDDAKGDVLQDTTEAAKNDITQTVIPELDDKISASQERADSAYDLAWDAESLANNALDAVAGVEGTLDAWTYKGTTKIDGNMLQTGTVRASVLEGGQVSILAGTAAETQVGYMKMERSTSVGLTLQSAYTLRLIAAGNVYIHNSNNGNTIQLTQSSFPNAIAVTCDQLIGSGGGSDLGASGRKWKDIYLQNEPWSTSDQNEKNSIERLPEKYLAIFDSLVPRRFKLNNGTSDRYHVGFIAQEVENAMIEAGVDSQEFGGFGKGYDPENERDVYMLRYGEFIAILAAKLQDVDKRVNALEETA